MFSQDSAGESKSSRLRLDEMHAALTRCLIFVPSKPRIEASGTVVTLRGHVGSYYQKQLAQEALRPLLDDHTLINELEVRIPRP